MLARTVSTDYWGDSLEWAEEERRKMGTVSLGKVSCIWG